MKLAVFLPNWVGDVVMATPALRALRRGFASDRIAYVGRPVAIDTLAGTPWADGTIVDRSAGGHSKRLEFCRLVLRLRQERFDRAILLPNSFRSALTARLGGIGSLAGYDRNGRGWMLHDKLSPPMDSMGFVPVPAIDYYNALVAHLGVDLGEDSRRMELPVVAADERAAQLLLDQAKVDPARPIVMLNPGAAFGASKLWDTSRFAALGDALMGLFGAQIILNAAPSERPIAARVAEAMKNPPAVNFATRDNSMGLLKALMRRCHLLVTNDTGARHVGAASGISVVTIFGSTDPDWATIYYERERLVRTQVACAPCQKKMCPQPAGPLYHQCMASITVDMVLAACQALLEQYPPGRSSLLVGRWGGGMAL